MTFLYPYVLTIRPRYPHYILRNSVINMTTYVNVDGRGTMKNRCRGVMSKKFDVSWTKIHCLVYTTRNHALTHFSSPAFIIPQ